MANFGSYHRRKKSYDKDGYDWDGFDKSGAHRLHRAVLNNDLKTLKKLLDQGVDVDIETQNERCSALYIAAGNGRAEIAKELLERKANVNKTDWRRETPLIVAAARGRCTVLELLLAQKADLSMRATDGNPMNNDPGETALEVAGQWQPSHAVHILLTLATNAANGTSIQYGSDGFCKQGWHKLHAAACTGDAKTTEALLKSGVDPNLQTKTRRTSLEMASQLGHEPILLMLLEQRAAIAEACVRAADEGQLAVVKLLLRHRADLVVTSKGETALSRAQATKRHAIVALLEAMDKFDASGLHALHHAARNGDVNGVLEQLNLGVPPDLLTKNDVAKTPLFEAVEAGCAAVVRTLLAHRADVSRRNAAGHTALEVATESKHAEIVALLQGYDWLADQLAQQRRMNEELQQKMQLMKIDHAKQLAARLPIVKKDAVTNISAPRGTEHGVLYFAKLLQNGQSVDIALKFPPGGERATSEHWHEFTAYLRVHHPHHPNLIRLLGICCDLDIQHGPLADGEKFVAEPLPGTHCLVFERAQRGSIADDFKESRKIGSLPPWFNPAKPAAALLQIARGLAHLHSNGVFHRDLAADNALVFEEKKADPGDAKGAQAVFTLKLSDFGLARVGDANGLYLAKYGLGSRFRWMAPESFKDSLFSAKTDAWMFAVCAWEILHECKQEPFPKVDDVDVKGPEWHSRLKTGCEKADGPFFLGSTLPSHCPPALRKLLCKCWSFKADDRPDMPSVVKAVRARSDVHGSGPLLFAAAAVGRDAVRRTSSQVFNRVFDCFALGVACCYCVCSVHCVR